MLRKLLCKGCCILPRYAGLLEHKAIFVAGRWYAAEAAMQGPYSAWSFRCSPAVLQGISGTAGSE